MRFSARYVGRATAIAATVVLLMSALPATMATAAPSSACKVKNLDSGIGRNSLQRAVWAASPGDHLVVQGTCTGSTLIAKDLRISGVRTRSSATGAGPRDSGPAVLKSGSWRPALVVDPRVTRLTIAKGLTVRRGIVIDDVRRWRSVTASTAPLSWTREPTAVTSAGAAAARRATACDVRGHVRSYRYLPAAARGASANEFLYLKGTCRGNTFVDKALYFSGVRIAASALTCDAKGVCRTSRIDSGPPTIRSIKGSLAVVVAPGVSDLTIKGITIKGGFAIGDTPAYRRFAAR